LAGRLFKIIPTIMLLCILFSQLMGIGSSNFNRGLTFDTYSISPENIYSLSGNPAFLALFYTQNFNAVYLTDNYENRRWKRTFDADKFTNYGGELRTFNILDETNTIILTKIQYNRQYVDSAYRSLEKHFYDHYYGFTDTTTGNFKYHGPQFEFTLQQKMNSFLNYGVTVRYGIELGIKDVYTQSESKNRDFEIINGITLGGNNSKVKIGAFFRYYDRQIKNEAVEEYEEAKVNTYLGYHTFTSRHGSAVTKGDRTKGGELGLQIKTEKLCGGQIDFYVSSSILRQETDVEIGYSNKIYPFGYWQREGKQIEPVIILNAFNEKLKLEINYQYQVFSDWSIPFDYDAINLENDQVFNQIGTKFYIYPGSGTGIILGGKYGLRSVDYNEYTTGFRYKEDLSNMSIFSKISRQVNQIIKVYFEFEYFQEEPWFYWNSDRLSGYDSVINTELLTIYGIFGVGMGYQVITPENSSKTNNIYQLKFYIRK